MPDDKALSVNVESFASDFKNDLRDLLRASIARVMPPEMLDGLVKGAIDEFLRDKPVDQWGNPARHEPIPSGLKQVVRELMRKNVADAVVAYLQTEEWRTGFLGSQKSVIGEKLKGMITDLGPSLLLTMFASAVGSHIEQVNSRLSQLGMPRTY